VVSRDAEMARRPLGVTATAFRILTSARGRPTLF
jgi:hypothetical protein